MKVTLKMQKLIYVFQIDDLKYSEIDKDSKGEMTGINDVRKEALIEIFPSYLEMFYEGKPVINLCGGKEIKDLSKKIKKGIEYGEEEFSEWILDINSTQYFAGMVEVKPYENK